jgi:hypothetical protein
MNADVVARKNQKRAIEQTRNPPKTIVSKGPFFVAVTLGCAIQGQANRGERPKM